MSQVKFRLMLAVLGLLAMAAWTMLPKGFDAARLLAAADNPEKLTDIGLDRSFNRQVAAREMEAALAGDDADLAQSFLTLADARGIAVDARLRARVKAANDTTAAMTRTAGSFVDGFLLGQPSDFAGLAGTVTGDLFVYGDLRDAVRETANLARGEQADELILGLACVGLAITAGTYATLGAGAPARVGVSVMKAVGKSGRLTAKMSEALIRPLRAIVDTAALKRALNPRGLWQPVVAVRGARAAVKIDKAQGLVRMLGDAGRISAKAGTRAALDGLKLAEGPKDVARLARVSAVTGGGTRAVLKLLGRGAIALTVGMFNLASWIFWALINLVGLVVALKAATERATLRYLQRQKLVRARRLAAVAPAG